MIEDRNGIKYLIFGTGDIGVGNILFHDDLTLKGVGFWQTEPGEISRELGAVGKSIEEIKTQVVMQFNNSKSAQVIINALQNCKTELENQGL